MMCCLHCPHRACIDPDYVVDISVSDLLKKTSDWVGHCPVYAAGLTLAGGILSCSCGTFLQDAFSFCKHDTCVLETTLGNIMVSATPVTLNSRHSFYIQRSQSIVLV